MESISFEEITEDTLYIALEMINSNPEYNLLEHGKEMRTEKDLRLELLNERTTSVFIKLDDTYIGVIDYLVNNPKDNQPWLGVFLIHRDYQGYGFGSQAYFQFEKQLLKKAGEVIRIGVLKENRIASEYWEAKGFSYYQTTFNENGKEILCLEKRV
ncbi:GNAT family N-acetyltransferase [Anaerobacillus isosaccharinicus]|uniref:GNAT family N-acetyltransferase n=1 Tax=Anaerobacillus isosaccharinicus TaxID=1532552 RepID=A0A7S7RB87_9BACI|nr:GNAT family N-acetyltransferase [Anaerobacillus isosaccharinicus]MBA5586034.1 GNAT family N-acetyltransferase [Anaerobacillus isosaccharinicus]QOY35690.1 GNAT family N-acetyltransferase [Anaerobacillus isosaccharinicus]